MTDIPGRRVSTYARRPRLSQFIDRRSLVRGLVGVGGLATLSACGVLPTPTGSRPSLAGHTPHVAVVFSSQPAPGYRNSFDDILQGFRDLGYQLGADIVVDLHVADQVENLPALLTDLLQSAHVDVLVPTASPAAVAAKAATTTTPIVFVEVNDPVGQGLVTSLSRPGGNVTGLSTLSGALNGKRVDLLRESFPAISRTGVVFNAANTGMALALDEAQAAATLLRLTLLPHGVRRNEDVAAALDDVWTEGPDALMLMPSLSPLPISLVQDFAAAHAVPVIFSDPQMVAAGGLMGLGPDYPDIFHRAASLVDRILHNARPADVPIEQPSRFGFAVNLRTATAMGLTFPESVLLQATDILR